MPMNFKLIFCVLTVFYILFSTPKTGTKLKKKKKEPILINNESNNSSSIMDQNQSLVSSNAVRQAMGGDTCCDRQHPAPLWMRGHKEAALPFTQPNDTVTN